MKKLALVLIFSMILLLATACSDRGGESSQPSGAPEEPSGMTAALPSSAPTADEENFQENCEKMIREMSQEIVGYNIIDEPKTGDSDWINYSSDFPEEAGITSEKPPLRFSGSFGDQNGSISIEVIASFSDEDFQKVSGWWSSLDTAGFDSVVKEKSPYFVSLSFSGSYREGDYRKDGAAKLFDIVNKYFEVE